MSPEQEKIIKTALGVPELLRVLAPLVAIADAYDADELRGDARPSWNHPGRVDFVPPDRVELFRRRNNTVLLTLADCLAAREVVRAVTGVRTTA